MGVINRLQVGCINLDHWAADAQRLVLALQQDRLEALENLVIHVAGVTLADARFESFEQNLALGLALDLKRIKVKLFSERQESCRVRFCLERAFDDERPFHSELCGGEIEQHVVAGQAQLFRPRVVLPAQAIKEQFLDAVLVDKGQPEFLRDAPAERRLAGAWRPGDDDDPRLFVSSPAQRSFVTWRYLVSLSLRAGHALHRRPGAGCIIGDRYRPARRPYNPPMHTPY